MHLDDSFLYARDASCVTCPTQAPSCTCATTQQCIIIERTCSQCSSVQCVASDDPVPSSGKSVSGGAVAGGVIGALIFLSASIFLFIWYRKRLHREKTTSPAVSAKPDSPANAATVLSRPDPVEKPRSPSPSPEQLEAAYMMSSEMARQLGATHLQNGHPSLQRRPSGRGSVVSNPFTDTQSIRTTSASTQSTNVIPIALVPHGTITSPPHSPSSERASQASSVPSRPSRSPEVNIGLDPLQRGLNLEHVNLSQDTFRPPYVPYAQSQISGISGISSRASVMTSGSFASDVLTEAPQIITPNSSVRVLGVAKAEVILAPPSNPTTPLTVDGLRPNNLALISRPSLRSPLASSSFGPGDVLTEEGQEIEIPMNNPFGDEHSSIGPTSSAMSFSSSNGPLPSTASPTHIVYKPPLPPLPSQRIASPEPENSFNSRPISTMTAATSIIGANIESATIVRLMPTSAPVSARSANRMTSGRLISPGSGPLPVDEDSTMQRQQAQALAVARGVFPPPPPIPDEPARSHVRRISAASMATTVSVGGDSLLESFTFVPPSPISSRPSRSPLGSPLGSPGTPKGLSPGRGENIVVINGNGGNGNYQLQPPSAQSAAPNVRQLQGMSTASTGSALEGYPFHLASGSQPPTPSAPQHLQSAAGSNDAHSSKRASHRQRASLDTLALTADLSAFPLNFDEGPRESFGPSK